MKKFLNIGIIAILIAVVAFGFTATYATESESYIDTKAPTPKKREPVAPIAKQDVENEEVIATNEVIAASKDEIVLEEDEAVYDDEIEEAGEDDIETLTYNLIHEKLTTPLREKVKKTANKKRFSRCPSGYQPSVENVATTETQYSYGTMELYEGCEPTLVCNFRTRLSDKSVHILQSDSVNYVSVDLWLSNATSSIK